MNTAQSARFLGCSRQAVQKMIKDGRLPAVKVTGEYVIRLSDIIPLRHKPLRGRPRKEKGIDMITGNLWLAELCHTIEGLSFDIARLKSEPRGTIVPKAEELLNRLSETCDELEKFLNEEVYWGEDNF